MLIADTSIWIDHFRKADVSFSHALGQRKILMHPFVLVEIALGLVPRFAKLVHDLHDLPQALVASPPEVMRLIVDQKLSGSGIGYVDTHLVASALLMPGTSLWTRDKRLRTAAERLSIASDPD